MGLRTASSDPHGDPIQCDKALERDSAATSQPMASFHALVPRVGQMRVTLSSTNAKASFRPSVRSES